MAASDHLGQQFHEMTRGEFESQPGTWFHGSANGMVGGHGTSFHVGTRKAATDALRKPPEGGGMVTSGVPPHSMYWADKPEVTGGRIVGQMTNTPHIDPSRGPGSDWEVAEGIPRGEMADWRRRSSAEPHSDVRANALEHSARNSGRPLKRGFYYSNMAEGGEGKKDVQSTISAVLPNRAAFKTHEDYLVEARAQGKKIPKRALQGYTEAPGQGRLL